MPETAKCRSCGAEILWVRTAATGSLMPLDAEPAPDGNVAVIDGVAHTLRGELYEPMLPAGPRYKSHFVTCPDGAVPRKAKKG